MICREWCTTLAPILISFSRNDVNVQCRTAYGSTDCRRKLPRLMRQYPSLYADISSLTQINKLGALREVLRRPEFRDCLVYGTDFPLNNMPVVSP